METELQMTGVRALPSELFSSPVPEIKKEPPKRFQFVTPDGLPIKYDCDKWVRDTIADYSGYIPVKKGYQVTVENPNYPLQGGKMEPGKNHPICVKCKLDQCGADNPYIPYTGSENPKITVLMDSVSRKDDKNGSISLHGWTKFIADTIDRVGEKHGISSSDVRWVPLTRCASWEKKAVNYKSKGRWCRHFALHDIQEYPPNVLMPVGSAALGLLCHKSNAEDWSGKLLTWRGWPDDWLMNPSYALPRTDPANPESEVVGHPLFGRVPTTKLPMVPVQAPRIVQSYANDELTRRWKSHVEMAVKIAANGVQPNSYARDWYDISEDFDYVQAKLKKLIALCKNHPGLIVSYDTETTGLNPWVTESYSTTNILELQHSKQPKIVFVMFRWINPVTDLPESLGFPWDFSESKLCSSVSALTPLVMGVLVSADVVGHNLSFDQLFTLATMLDEKERNRILNKLADSAKYDTWHMAYTLRQQKQSLGLEALAYRFTPDLAGYEEDMTLLIGLRAEMDPEQGGHYAMCPKEKWETHLKPYVMGDVEVTYRARDEIAAKLAKAETYTFKIHQPGACGKFRLFTPPRRDWTYANIISPASRLLLKMMGRGFHVDRNELSRQELEFPQMVQRKIEAVKTEVDPKIPSWIERKQQDPDFEFDLENKKVLKELLFDLLGLDVQRLTKTGRKLYGETKEEWSAHDVSREEMLNYAAVDKFTLNKLAVDYPQIRPLQEYRKLYKLYTTYIRSMRNLFTPGLDKKHREKDAHLAIDGCVHTQFLLARARTGRLSSSNPNLQNLSNEGPVKKIFASRFGKEGCLFANDLSQIELRLMAAFSGDESMVNAYITDQDLHSLTASRIYKLPYEMFTKAYFEKLQKEGNSLEAKKLELKRKLAKTSNFLTGYGGGGFGLQTTLANQSVYLDIEECEKTIELFFEAYPTLKKFLGYYKAFVLEHGVAVSIFGRIRVFEEVYSDDGELVSKAVRAGCNHIIQSSASDLMLIVMMAIEALMRDYELESMLVSTVHDSLVIDAKIKELPVIHEITSNVLNAMPDVLQVMFGENYDTSWIKVLPFAGDSSVGVNYLDQVAVGKNPDWDQLLAISAAS